MRGSRLVQPAVLKGGQKERRVLAHMRLDFGAQPREVLLRESPQQERQQHQLREKAAGLQRSQFVLVAPEQAIEPLDEQMRDQLPAAFT